MVHTCPNTFPRSSTPTDTCDGTSRSDKTRKRQVFRYSDGISVATDANAFSNDLNDFIPYRG